MRFLFLSPLIALIYSPALANVDPKIHEICLPAVDYKGCVSANQTQIKLQSSSNTEKTNELLHKKEKKKLSNYGIVDYQSAVIWCRKKITGNLNPTQTSRVKLLVGDFCRNDFIPLLQSPTGELCEDCDLDPIIIFTNLIDNINNKDTEEPAEPADFNNGLSKYLYIEEDFPNKNNQNDTSKKKNPPTITNQSKDKIKGIYMTGSIGVSKIGDIDVEGIASDIELDSGTNFEIGVGYDLGKTRLETTWERSNSQGVSWLGYSIKSTAIADSFLASAIYDFENNSRWTPFAGVSIGSSKVEINNENASSIAYGVQTGLGYQSSDKVEFFVKINRIVTNKLDFSSSDLTNANTTGIRIGARFAF